MTESALNEGAFRTDVVDGITIDWDVPVEAGDGNVLRADVFRPSAPGSYPVILSYGPYGKGVPFQAGLPAAWQAMVDEYPEVLAGSSAKYQVFELVDPETERGVRSSIVRLAPLVHSRLDRHGFTPALIAIARTKGVSAYVGDGSNRWPAVHTLDAARLYRLALEQAPAGSRLHAVAEDGIPFREIAEVIGRHADVPVKSIDPAEAAGHFGYLAPYTAVDNHVSSALTRQAVGWEPAHPGWVEDLNQGHYFSQPTD